MAELSISPGSVTSCLKRVRATGWVITSSFFDEGPTRYIQPPTGTATRATIPATTPTQDMPRRDEAGRRWT
ncbi:MAG: hypothetical protein R3C10_02030 [Pirellulales bacterium]